MSLLVTCFLTVAYYSAGDLVQHEVLLDGTAHYRSNSYYIVDFSTEAKKAAYIGDFKRIVVPVKNCLKP